MKTPSTAQKFLAPLAWINGEWAENMLLCANATGHWQSIETAASQEESSGAIVLQGPIIPGIVNAHSHAFQRSIAGLTEEASANISQSPDSFWTWRNQMYSAAQNITPAQLEQIAAGLYQELLLAGYTQVCEFNYLHNDTSGNAYADPLAFSMALVAAAKKTGIGLTLLPTLYMRSGFGAKGLRADQQRFASTLDSVFSIAQAINDLGEPLINAGIALHSLRAVHEAAVIEAALEAQRLAIPIHIHIAEQTQEVDDCIAQHGERPIEWLLNHVGVNQHWNLVHATHATEGEINALAQQGASVVLCPTTEANLGDGIFNLPALLKAKGRWSIGSDSHVTRSWVEELRLLEYSQRLQLRKRNVAATHSAIKSTGNALLLGSISGATAACAKPVGQIAIGNRADFCVLNTQARALKGVAKEYLIDALVFSSPSEYFLQTYVAAKNESNPNAR